MKHEMFLNSTLLPQSSRTKPAAWSKKPNNNNNTQDDADEDPPVSSPKNKTIILMVDSRSLDMDLNNTYIYWRWAAEMNFYYAQKHRYDFQYIRSQSYDDPYHNKSLSPERINSLENDGTDGITKTKAHCYLEIPSQNLSVSRGAAWCKLLAIASVLDRGHYSTIVLLDSDMFFQLDAPKISSLIDTYRIDFKNERDNSTTPFTEPTVWFSSNHPWGTYHRNTAMQIWQVNPQQQQHDSRREGHVWKLLRQWWQINKNPQSHAYEQSALWIIAGVW
eukprot:CAMPEP_0172444910 /NCGR_PEP_ID=MMETSP1065-20121228/4925_1 /TAXON_ID=265537 /ORGANISM="Amphiprora paludosa, Strain CCMP125" /LENGTH=275 /DNA_ID=CAMNT_0013195671 /DNA_START=199 /DNA_END=1023 /DNA_ORIENTATION=+